MITEAKRNAFYLHYTRRTEKRKLPHREGWKLMKCGDDFLEGHHLVAVRRRRHENQRVYTGIVPGRDPFAYIGGGAIQRDLLQPTVGQELGNFVVLFPGDSLLDRAHFLLESSFDPILLIIGQTHVIRQRASMDGGGGCLILGDTGRDHIG